MLAWIIVIIALALFNIFAFSYSFPENYLFFSTVLVFIATLGLLYRVYWKKNKDAHEKMQKEIEELKAKLEQQPQK